MPIHDTTTEMVETGDVEFYVRVPNLQPFRAGGIAQWAAIEFLREFAVSQIVEYKEGFAEK